MQELNDCNLANVIRRCLQWMVTLKTVLWAGVVNGFGADVVESESWELGQLWLAAQAQKNSQQILFVIRSTIL